MKRIKNTHSGHGCPIFDLGAAFTAAQWRRRRTASCSAVAVVTNQGTVLGRTESIEPTPRRSLPYSVSLRTPPGWPVSSPSSSAAQLLADEIATGPSAVHDRSTRLYAAMRQPSVRSAVAADDGLCSSAANGVRDRGRVGRYGAAADVLDEFGVTAGEGLSSDGVARRQARCGPNAVSSRQARLLPVLWHRLRSPARPRPAAGLCDRVEHGRRAQLVSESPASRRWRVQSAAP
jgi:hypothetical protein